jgi:archaellum biogenesis protein FlaJ (TadC family)
MKCENCGGTIRPQDRRCRRCGHVPTRPSDDLRRKMTLSPRVAVSCGALLVVIAALLFLNGTVEFAAVLLFLGVPLALIGLFMR